jgi:hypothetical protein
MERLIRWHELCKIEQEKLLKIIQLPEMDLFGGLGRERERFERMK